MSKNKEIEAVILGLLALLLTPVSIVWIGWIYACLWAWFVVTTFKAPVISVPVAIGLTTLWGLLKFRTGPKPKGEEPAEAFGRFLSAAFIVPGICLFVGWIARAFA